VEKSVASEVSGYVLEVNRLLNRAAAAVTKSTSTEESAVFNRAIGEVLGVLLLEVVNPLYRAHPDLKPSDLYVPSPPP
jgi:hypothetical protein